MIFIDSTLPPNTVMTWAPRYPAALAIDRCGVIIYLSINAQYYFDSTSQALAGVGLLPPSAAPPPAVGRNCWVEYHKASGNWHKSIVRGQTLASLFIDPIAAIPEKMLAPVNVKIVKFWTD